MHAEYDETNKPRMQLTYLLELQGFVRKQVTG